MEVLFGEIQEAAGRASIGLEGEEHAEPAAQAVMEGETETAT